MFVPAAAMGITFPLAIRWFSGGAGNAGRDAGGLYALNTAGAAAGALMTGFVLIPAIGLRATTLVGIGLNLTAATVAWLVAHRASSYAVATRSARRPRGGQESRASDRAMASGGRTGDIRVRRAALRSDVHARAGACTRPDHVRVRCHAHRVHQRDRHRRRAQLTREMDSRARGSGAVAGTPDACNRGDRLCDRLVCRYTPAAGDCRNRRQSPRRARDGSCPRGPVCRRRVAAACLCARRGVPHRRRIGGAERRGRHARRIARLRHQHDRGGGRIARRRVRALAVVGSAARLCTWPACWPSARDVWPSWPAA